MCDDLSYFTVFFAKKQLVKEPRTKIITSPSKEALVFPSRGEEEAVNGASRQQQAGAGLGVHQGGFMPPFVCSFLMLG